MRCALALMMVLFPVVVFAGSAPVVLDLDPVEGQPGDVIVFSGENLSEEPGDYRVVFVSADETVEIEGVITEVTGTGDDVEVSVVVPTGVRTGTIEVYVHDGEALVLAECDATGCDDFVAYPCLVGVTLGLDGDVGVINAFPDFFLPAGVHFHGYNFDNVDACEVSDKVFVEEESPEVIESTPDYELPQGTTAVSVEIPEDLTNPSILCTASTAPYEFIMSATLPSGDTVTLPLVEVQSATNFAGFLPDIVPATLTSLIVPSGVHRGQLELTYQLLEGGFGHAQSRWDLIPEFRDPAVDDDDDLDAWVACTPVDVTFANGDYVVPGSHVHPPVVLTMKSPGATTRFIWDTAADLPGELSVTRLRFMADNPTETRGDIGDCDNGIWETGPIVIDNRADELLATLEQSFVSVDDFVSGDADWDAAEGTVSGTTDGYSVFGDGSDDVELLSSDSYVFDTDDGTLMEISGTPTDVFTDNPGADLDPPEFWMATLLIESGAQVEVIGSNPLVIRCSGTDDPDETVVTIDGDIDLSGGDAEAATSTDPGIPGLGRAGGGSGGDAGFVVTDGMNAPGQITSVVHGQRGDNQGGMPGTSLSLLKPYPSISSPRSGPGGGGGHRDRGEDGLVSGSVTLVKSEPGAGGPARGSDRMWQVTAGSGGGAGSGCAVRTDDDPDVGIEGKFGGAGGAGGGALSISARGSIEISGAITTNGGAGSRGTSTGGAGPGGGGSGGGIRLQASADLEVTGLLLALGGAGGRAGSIQVGGAGSPGRIRLEANGELAIGDDVLCEDVSSDEDPTLGICPPPSSGAFETAGMTESRAVIAPVALRPGGVVGANARVTAPRIEYADRPDGTTAALLFEHAKESRDAIGTIGEFVSVGEEVDEVEGAQYVRMTLLLYSNEDTGEVPVVDSVSFTVDLDSPHFIRGDIDTSGGVFALIDALYLLDYGFNSGPDPMCMKAADVDGSGDVAVLLDALFLLTWQFAGGDDPPAPGTEECGPDASDLTCDETSDECA